MTGQTDTPTPNVPRTTAEMLQRIRTARAELDAIVAHLTPARLAVPGPDGGWSIKDHLAHVTAWEQITLGRLRGVPEHTLYGVDEGSVASLDIDRLNDILYRRDRQQPPEQVLAASGDSYAAIVSYVSAMPDAELQAPTAAEDDRPRGAKIAGDTYEHYAERAEWITSLLATG
jgi:hypothetical protein